MLGPLVRLLSAMRVRPDTLTVVGWALALGAAVLFGTLAGTALYGVVGAIFAVPIIAIVAATIRYLRGTLAFERWSKPPLTPEEPPKAEADSLPEAAGLGKTRRNEERGRG